MRGLLWPQKDVATEIGFLAKGEAFD